MPPNPPTTLHNRPSSRQSAVTITSAGFFESSFHHSRTAASGPIMCGGCCGYMIDGSIERPMKSDRSRHLFNPPLPSTPWANPVAHPSGAPLPPLQFQTRGAFSASGRQINCRAWNMLIMQIANQPCFKFNTGVIKTCAYSSTALVWIPSSPSRSL